MGGGRFCRGRRRTDFLATPQTCLNAGFAGPLRLCIRTLPAASGRLRRKKMQQVNVKFSKGHLSAPKAKSEDIEKSISRMKKC